MSIDKFSSSARDCIEYIQKKIKTCVNKFATAVNCNDPSVVPAFVIDWESVLALGSCTFAYLTFQVPSMESLKKCLIFHLWEMQFMMH